MCVCKCLSSTVSLVTCVCVCVQVCVDFHSQPCVCVRFSRVPTLAVRQFVCACGCVNWSAFVSHSVSVCVCVCVRERVCECVCACVHMEVTRPSLPALTSRDTFDGISRKKTASQQPSRLQTETS